jgi:hypothetical protein
MLRSSFYKINFSLLILSVCGAFVSANAQQSSSNTSLTIEVIEKIKPGKTKIDEVTKILGKPNKEIPFNKNGERLVTQIYLEGSPTSTRLSLIYDLETNTVDSFTWFPKENEKENYLKKVLKRYDYAHFKARQAEWINPHASPDEVFFEDVKLGLTITYLKTPNYVESIAWERPEKKKYQRAPTQQTSKIDYRIGG